MTLGELIIKFDNSQGTLKDFNTIFNTDLKGDDNIEVEIGSIVDHETRRNLLIGGENRLYNFSQNYTKEVEREAKTREISNRLTFIDTIANFKVTGSSLAELAEKTGFKEHFIRQVYNNKIKKYKIEEN